ncbi:MAG: type II secretion system protein [Opitutus sp.]|nr:type II secretion system protein [Opitutus sp.]
MNFSAPAPAPVEAVSPSPRFVRASPPRHGRRGCSGGGFTLAEVLAALLFMAIVIPVAMHGVSVASRAGILGQRKATAMRIAERVLDEQILTGLVTTAIPYGSIVDGDFTYPWALQSEPWTEDTTTNLTVVTVRVSFDVQGSTFDIAASTLYDPTVTAATTTSTTP